MDPSWQLPGLVTRQTGGMVWYQFPHLAEQDEIVHGVFTRHGGASTGPVCQGLNASLAVGDAASNVWENRARIMDVLGATEHALATLRQVHGREVVAVHEVPLGQWRPPEGDGMATRRPDVLLMMSYADCVPVLFYDPRRRVVAQAHAGWRGTLAGIVMATVEYLRGQFDCRPEDLMAAIAPAIGPCCYEVGEDMAGPFGAGALPGLAESVVRSSDMERPHLDLKQANHAQLVAAGVRPDHIMTAGICTACRTDLFYSHRAERGRTGRFAVAIGLKAR